MAEKNFEERLREFKGEYGPVVPFETNDRFLLMDFTENNKELNSETLGNTDLFIRYINAQLKSSNARYGIGGYNEHRTIYSRSQHFDAVDDAEPRRLHLGIDIWGKPYTKVMTPLNGIVHSFKFNNAFGDYGATLVIVHNLHGFTFHTLYGHLSLNSIKNIQEGDVVRKGEVIAEFGIPFENGQWPPHLHFQVIIDMEGKKGDYPGVCAISERDKYLNNCPDPDVILGMMEYASG
jgi:murein DD-endopeptidase MepM/ murein hydrolase activator NlpD